MARPKSYDRDAAVVAARDAFWEHGYATLGVRAIEQRSGINRYALTTDFGGKEQLFLECLDSYHAESEQWLLAPLDGGGIEAVRRMVAGLAAPADGSNRRHGCLMTNTVVENAPAASAAIRERTEHHFDRLARAIRAALGRAVERGEVADDLDLDGATSLLVGAVVAANVMNRNATDPTAAAPYARAVLDVVDGWRTTA